jgi:hypothetical protein
MRISISIISIAIVYSTAVLGQGDCPCWTPNAQQIAVIEEKIAAKPMPLGSLDRYARYYAGVTETIGDRRFIRGKFVPLGPHEASSVHIVEGKMPSLQGEGCISSSEPAYDRWFYFACARPGAWTPTGAQITKLEDTLRQQRGRGPEYAEYARHYAGVVEGDRRIIRGELVKRDETPGIYVESEAELPLISDGGCSVIHVRFEPLSNELEWRCEGRG